MEDKRYNCVESAAVLVILQNMKLIWEDLIYENLQSLQNSENWD